MARGRVENLIPFNQLTEEQHRKLASKAGKASVQAKKEKKRLKELVEIALDRVYKNEKGEEITAQEMMALKAVQEAIKGDWKAWEIVQNITGQKPAEQVILQTTSDDDIREVQKMIEDVRQEKGNTTTGK